MPAAADREAADRRYNPNAGREDLVHVGRGTVFHDNDAHEKER